MQILQIPQHFDLSVYFFSVLFLILFSKYFIDNFLVLLGKKCQFLIGTSDFEILWVYVTFGVD